MIKCQLVHPNARIPTRKPGDVGFDLYMPRGGSIHPNGALTVPLAISLSLPGGTFGLIKSRSSLFRKGIIIDGVIDSSYRGEICLMLHNISCVDYDWKAGDRLAQMLWLSSGPADTTTTIPIVEVDGLDETERGDGGFGSTGK